jgi:phosphate transport system permease protein
VGTYLAEYARNAALGNAVRFVSDVLLSAPSILVGLFVYQLVVLPMGRFSGIAGAAALAILVIPVVVRTTEDMLQLIPNTLREAVVGLGAPKWKMITLVCWRAALSGIVTGILLATARITGETAPLLLTSFGNNITSFDLGGAMASLPIAIYQQANSGFPDLIDIAWAGALIVTFGVLFINIIARFLLRGRK